MTNNKAISLHYGFIGITLLLYMFAAFLYWPAINGGLVWDDPALINRHNLLDTNKWFHNSFGVAFLSDAYYYRPLPLITLMLNGAWGAQHFIFLSHLSNVMIFCLNLTLVMALVLRISPRHLTTSALAGFVYCIHPALVESTAWISGRCDLLLTFFVLLALYLDVVLKNYFKLKTALVSFCFLLAALSKEMAIVFPAILLCWKLYFENAQFTLKGLATCLNNNRVYFLFVILAGIAYLIIRITLLGSLFGAQAITTNAGGIGTPVNHFYLVMKTLSWYWLLQLFPHYDLSAIYYTKTPVTLHEPAVWYGMGILALSFVVFKSRLLAARNKYALILLLMLFLPVSNLKPTMAWDNFIHLRFLTLPIGCLIVLYMPLAVDWLSTQRKQLRTIIVASTVIWCLSSLANVVVTVPLWSHERFLWKWMTQTRPDSYLAWDNYAASLLAEKDFENCTLAAEASIRLNANNGKAYVTAAQCYFEKRDFKKAQALVDSVLNSNVMIDSVTFSSLLTTSALLDMKDIQNHTALNETIINKLKQAISHHDANNRARYLLVAWSIKNGNNNFAEILALESYQKNPGIRVEDILALMRSEAILDTKQEDQLRVLLLAAQTQTVNTHDH